MFLRDKNWAAWLLISGDLSQVSDDMTSGEMTLKQLVSKPLSAPENELNHLFFNQSLTVPKNLLCFQFAKEVPKILRRGGANHASLWYIIKRLLRPPFDYLSNVLVD